MKKILFMFSICAICMTGCGDITTSQENSCTNDIPQKSNPDQSNSEKNDTNEDLQIDSDIEVEYNIINILGEENFIKELNEIKFEVSQNKNQTQEILFNDIPWETNYSTANEIMKNIDGFCEMSMQNIPIPLNTILGFDERFPSEYYDFTNIGGITWSTLDNMTVAGYEVDECRLIFSSVLKENEYILTDEDSSLYGAYYILKKNTDEQKMKDDLLGKLTSIYGEPSKIIKYQLFQNNDYTEEYIYWYGSSDTVLMLHDNQISYAWLGGEELLNNALQAAEKQQQEDAESVYGNGNTDGL